jgi:putative NADPH-quinone reductase
MWLHDRLAGSSRRPSVAHELHSALSRLGAPRDGTRDREILIVNGHPDPRPERFCAALCEAYAAGAHDGGWRTGLLNVGELVPHAAVPVALAGAAETIRRADELAIVFPLWLDRPPEVLCRLFSLVAHQDKADHTRPGRRRRPARIFVTMEMPAFAHRSICRAEAPVTRALSLTDAIAGEPVFIGSVDTISAVQRAQWLRELHGAGGSRAKV